eukprot:23540_1
MTFMKNVVINSFELYCSADDRTCSEVIMIFPTNVTVNSYELSCGYPACAFIQLEAAKAVIGDLNLHCSYCLNMDINAKISKSANISCTGTNACQHSNVNLIPATLDVNVNIKCNGIGACNTLALFVNSEMNLLQISCGVSSCAYMQLNASNTTINQLKLDCTYCLSIIVDAVIGNSANISCTNSGACRYGNVRLISAASDVKVNLICSGNSGCREMDINIASTSALTAINSFVWQCSATSSCEATSIQLIENLVIHSFKLLCGATSSCEQLIMTVSSNVTVNSYQLSCGASISACNTFQLNAANAVFNHLNVGCVYCPAIIIAAQINNSANIICMGVSSCTSASITLMGITTDVNIDIECVNMDTSTSYSTGACYNSYFYIYGYVNSNRAKRNNLTLITGQYDFHSGHMYVYDLYETDINCQAPYSCGAATINTSSSQKMSLHCTNYAACDSLTTTLPMNKENNSSQLSCIGSYSCNSLKILFPSKRVFNSYQLSCNGSFSCNSITMRFPSNSIITLYQLSCNGPSSCGSLTTIFPENSIINSYQLSCGESACPSIRLNAATAIINELSMECIYCYNMDIDAKINNYANVNCIGTNSCESANVNLLSTSTDATVNIDCVNVEVSTMDLTGACLNSYWYIYGYLSNGDKNNNLTFINGQYDLYNGHIYGYNLYTTTIYCNTPYSCANAVINTKSSKTLDLRCKDDYSCYGATVYCPQGQVEKNCVIQCTKTTISTAKNCAEMMINASFSSNLTLFSGGTDMTVYIPQNDNGHPRFSIIEGYHFYGTTDPGMFLYAVNGFDDINFINYNGYKYGGDWAHMICGTEKCKISSTQWECSDPLSICNGNISSSSYPLCLTYNVTFKAMSHIDDNSSLINIDWNGLFATKPYIVYIGKYLYGSTIRCRDIPQPNECYIKCMTEQSCLDVYINPIASLSLLSIICEEKK